MGKTPEQERKIYGFMLPDLLGKPLGMTDAQGNMIFLSETEFPPDHYIFFLPIKEWLEIKEIRGEK